MLTTKEHLGILRSEGARLALTPTEFLDAPVPSLPDWTVERVVRHVGKTHQWVTELLASPADIDPGSLTGDLPGLTRGPECLGAYGVALSDVLTALDSVEPDRRVASFVGVDDVRFWCRRQAHEVTVHRSDVSDAVYAAGGPPPPVIDPVGAVDGIDEWLQVFVANLNAQQSTHLNETLGGQRLLLTTEDVSWLVQFDSDGPGCVITADPSAAEASAAGVSLRGDPASLLLCCWRRRPLEQLEITGERGLAATFFDQLRF